MRDHRDKRWLFRVTRRRVRWIPVVDLVEVVNINLPHLEGILLGREFLLGTGRAFNLRHYWIVFLWFWNNAVSCPYPSLTIVTCSIQTTHSSALD